jgi:hypothetical protein
MRENCTSGLMSGIWKRTHGTASEAPKTEKFRKQIGWTYTWRARSRLYWPRFILAFRGFCFGKVVLVTAFFGNLAPCRPPDMFLSEKQRFLAIGDDTPPVQGAFWYQEGRRIFSTRRRLDLH